MDILAFYESLPENHINGYLCQSRQHCYKGDMREHKFDPKKIYRYDSRSETFSIDIDLDFYREMYSAWDFSPQHNRDFDENLLQYLEACCEDIPHRYKVDIAMSLPERVYNQEREERATAGYRNFFSYLVRREHNRSRRYYSKISKFLLLGLTLLLLSSFLERILAEVAHTEILVEGLIIGAWVSIWEVFSILFFQLSEHRQKIRTYQRLLRSKISYRYRPTPQNQSPDRDRADLPTD